MKERRSGSQQLLFHLLAIMMQHFKSAYETQCYRFALRPGGCQNEPIALSLLAVGGLLEQGCDRRLALTNRLVRQMSGRGRHIQSMQGCEHDWCSCHC